MGTLRDQLRLTLSPEAVEALYPSDKIEPKDHTVLGFRVLLEIVGHAELWTFPRSLQRELVRVLANTHRRIWLVEDDDGTSILITGLTPRS